MNWRLSSLLLLAVLALAGAFLACFEPVRESVDVGYQGEARVNPYLAFERLLGELGAPAETTWGDVELPAGDHTLVLLGREPLPPNLGLAELLAWVEKGGQLVATPAAARHSDLLLRHFGVRVVELDEKGDDGEEVAREEGGPAEGAEAEQLPPGVQEILDELSDGLEKVTVELPWVETPFDATLPASLVFAAEEEGGGDPLAEVTFASERLHLVDYGAGTVWFVIDSRFLENDRIGRLDHARLAWALVEWEDEAGDHRGDVTLAVRDSPPGLLSLLWRGAWPAAVSGALLLVALLAALSGRLGPLRRPPGEERRRLLEHVEASGVFLWHQGRVGDLLAAAREALIARLERREPTWAKLPPQELVERLSAHSGVAAGRLASALYAPPAAGRTDPAAFTDSIATLETVRRTL